MRRVYLVLIIAKWTFSVHYSSASLSLTDRRQIWCMDLELRQLLLFLWAIFTWKILYPISSLEINFWEQSISSESLHPLAVSPLPIQGNIWTSTDQGLEDSKTSDLKCLYEVFVQKKNIENVLWNKK